jgi:hypothetical protein
MLMSSSAWHLCPVAHRIVWEYRHGPIPDGLEVNHRKGVKDDNRIDNLELLTNVENVGHAHRAGLIAPRRGEMQGGSKLTDVV